jgi:hypothetical protein
MLGAFQHTYDNMNSWCVLVSESEDISPIVIRGRESYEALKEDERFRFDHIHLHLLNIFESHLYQVHQTAMDEEYRRWAVENFQGIAKGYFDFPGTRQFWRNVRGYFPPDIQRLVDSQLEEDERKVPIEGSAGR